MLRRNAPMSSASFSQFQTRLGRTRDGRNARRIGINPVFPIRGNAPFQQQLFRKEALAALQRRDDALICYPLPGLNDLYKQISSLGIPLVFIGDRPIDVENESCVMWDAGAAAAAAVQHLVIRGESESVFWVWITR